MAAVHSHEMNLPRGPLIGGAALVIATIVTVAAVRLSGVDISAESRAPIVAERMLRFVDLADGRIEVREGERVLRTIAAGDENFVRGALRALARERRLQQVGSEPPFRLVAHADGRLTLFDPSTGRRLDLESFGPDNSASFARLLADNHPPAAVR